MKQNKNIVSSHNLVERKKGETEEAYQKRIEKATKKIQEYWTEERRKNATPK